MDHGFCSAIVIVVPRFVYRERGSMNQTEEDGYVAKCFSEDCLALSAYHPLPPFARILTTPQTCIREFAFISSRSFQPEAFSFVYIDLGEMFLFRRENRGGKARRWRDRRIEIMIILFNIFSFFFFKVLKVVFKKKIARKE